MELPAAGRPYDVLVTTSSVSLSRFHVLAAAGFLAVSACAVAATPSDASSAASATEDIIVTLPADDGTPLRLGFERPEQPAGSVVTDVVNSGEAGVSISVVTANGGSLRALDQRGQSIRTPDFSASENPPRAVLSIRSDDEAGDVLNPGDAPFVFGADFALDRVSDGSSVDNGDNLVQRGLAGDPTQYKLELDARRPTCRIHGSRGDVRVVSPVQAEAGAWYRVRCLRQPAAVTLVVTDLETGRETVTVEAGSTGSLSPESGRVPLSVGGKLHTDGSLVDSATDQFNGAVDLVKLRIL